MLLILTKIYYIIVTFFKSSIKGIVKCYKKIIPLSLRSILKAIFCYRRRFVINRCATLNDKCIVIMNGPSLLNDIEKIRKTKDCYHLVVNYFAEHDYFTDIKPEFYVMQDNSFWREDVLEHFKEKRERTFECLNCRVNWDMTLFIPSFCNKPAYISYLYKKIKNPKINIFIYNAQDFRKGTGLNDKIMKVSNILFWLWSKSVMAPPTINVLISGLYIAERLGFKKIDFCGADMSMFKNISVNQDTNAVGIEFEYFYGTEFRERYRDNQGKYKSSMSFELYKWGKVFQSLEVISTYLCRQGVQTRNISSFSFIDSFDRGE